MKRLLKPFIALMDGLRYPQKMAIVAFTFFLPGIALIFLLIYEINTTIGLTQNEISGVEYNRHLMRLLHDLQLQRGMVHATLRGEPAFREKITAHQSRIEEQIKKIGTLNKKFEAPDIITGKWDAIELKYQDLKERLLRLEAKEYFSASTSLVADILGLMTHASDTFKLMSDPDVETHYMVHIMFLELPVLIEKTARIRGWGTGVATAGTLTDDMRLELIALSGQAGMILDDISRDIQRVFNKRRDLSPALAAYINDASSSTGLFLGLLSNEIINAKNINIKPADYFASGTKAIDSSFTLYNALIPAFNNLLQIRMERLSHKKYLFGYAAAAALLIGFCLFAGFYMSVMNSLKSLEKASGLIARGDLTARAKIESTDEMLLVAKSFNDMASILEKNIIRIKQSEEQAKRSLKEKELRLKEIHHRVKNNLQLVSSLLNLQSGSIMDAQVSSMFNESRDRIRTIAAIHEILYQSEDMEIFNLKAFVQRLVSDLYYSYGIYTGAITLNTGIDNAKLGINTAIPLGLIINELVSNSLKHAFPEGKKGEIFIGLHADSNNKFTLTVSDNGIGFPDSIDFSNPKSLGLRMVLTLVKQLEGAIRLDRTGGTSFIISLTESK